jgi:hypothetical protein
MKLPRRAFLPVAAGVAVLPVAAQVARAQTYRAGGLRNTINVADFGARGNGSTDDTAALNAAFASVLGSQALVLIPNGTYKITDTIVIGSASGGAGAPTSFISIWCPGGPEGVSFRWMGPLDRPAVLFAKNKYLVCHGLKVLNTQGSTGTSIA